MSSSQYPNSPLLTRSLSPKSEPKSDVLKSGVLNRKEANKKEWKERYFTVNNQGDLLEWKNAKVNQNLFILLLLIANHFLFCLLIFHFLLTKLPFKNPKKIVCKDGQTQSNISLAIMHCFGVQRFHERLCIHYFSKRPKIKRQSHAFICHKPSRLSRLVHSC